MHIAIEGVDGVGKSTISSLLAEKLNFKFIEKPLHYLLDSDNKFDNYFRIRDYVNTQDHNKIFTSWFYGLGNIFLYHKFQNENIVTDRHLVSNYFWSGDDKSAPVFDCLVDLLRKPDYTFLLYAKKEVVLKRLKNRNANDSDINKVGLVQEAYLKMESFLKKYEMKYKVIDTTLLNAQEVVDEILTSLSDDGMIEKEFF
ncbi:MAG: AAA family ATPase [Promethearchaeota archaeon]